MTKPITETMVNRLNAIMYAIRLHPMTIKQLYGEVGLGRRSMLTHVRKLLSDGKIVGVISPEDRRNKIYRIADGGMPYAFEPVIKPVREPKKRGPKPGAKKPEANEKNKVKIVKAAQIGMQRDPFQVLFFGAAQA